MYNICSFLEKIVVADIVSSEVKSRMATALEPADGEESIKCCVPFQVCQASYMGCNV